MKVWIAGTVALVTVAVAAVVIIMIRQPQSVAPVETPAEQARHAAERDKVMKDFYNPPKPETWPTGLYSFKAQETQPVTK